MWDALNNGCIYIMDFVLGWTLGLPRDVALLIVAILTGLILTLVRLFTTNQDWLKRCQKDKKRLKELIREAKSRGDKEAVRRHKDTVQLIGLKSFKVEGLPLLASLIPLALLGAWAFGRLGYLPPKPGQGLMVRVKFPPGDVGKLAYLVGQPGVEATNGWVQKIVQETKVVARPAPAASTSRPAPAGPVKDRIVDDPNGVAEWQLVCQKQSSPYALVFHQGGRSLKYNLIVDGAKYEPPESAFEEDPAAMIEVSLPEYKPFTIIGRLPAAPVPEWLKDSASKVSWWAVWRWFTWLAHTVLEGYNSIGAAIAPWIVGYLVIVIPLALVMKPILRIA